MLSLTPIYAALTLREPPGQVPSGPLDSIGLPSVSTLFRIDTDRRRKVALTVYDYREDVRNVLVTPQIRSRFMRLEPGDESGAHSHDLGHEVFLVLEGLAEFTIDGETGLVGPGQMCVALVDQLHSLRVIGDEPMTMYLSVTPHIQPTHTMWTDDGERLPHRFAQSSAYDRQTDSDTPLATLLDNLTTATLAVREAAEKAASTQESEAGGLAEAASRGDVDSSSQARDAIWDALFEVYRRSAELADLWNDVAPRAGRT